MKVGENLEVLEAAGQSLGLGIRPGDRLLLVDGILVKPSTWLDAYADAKTPFKVCLSP